MSEENFFVGTVRDNIQRGDVLTDKEQASLKKLTQLVIMQGDPEINRPIIDQPWTNGEFPTELHEQQALLSRMVNQYRQGNPMSIHGAGIIVPPYGALGEEEDPQDYDIRRLTDIFMRCKTTFSAMMQNAFDEDALPHTPRSDRFIWENVAFPRMMNDTNQIKAVLMLMELDKGHLVIHVVIVKQHEETAVFTTRISY